MYQTIDLKKLREENKNFISKTPREHQKDAFEKFSELYDFDKKEHKSGILVFPTGAGKTYTATSWICRNVLSKNVKVLWLAHTSHLLEQAYYSFQENLLDTTRRTNVNMRLVSSNKSHSNASEIKNTDDILIITSQTAINNFQTSALDKTGKKRVTAFEKFLNNSTETGLFVILDEAHHAPAYGVRNLLIGGNKFEKGIKQLISNSFFLGLTATPTYSDKKRRGWLWEIFNDGIIYEVDKSKLTKKNILAVPEYIQKNTGETFTIDDNIYNRITREHKDLPAQLVEELATSSPRNDYIVNEYINNAEKYGKTLIFADHWRQCVYIKEKLIAKGIKNVDAIYSRIDAKPNSAEARNQRTTSDNEQILKKFKQDELDILLNIKMLTEGTDVPSVKTVFITRQTTSSILLTQMVGRALRGKLAGGSDTANIVFFVDNWEKIINFATPYSGGLLETEPKTKGYYPIEWISISLVEELSRKIDSGIVFAENSFLNSLPLGWYETEITVAVEDGMETFKEFVIIYEQTKPKFDKFISQILLNLENDWEDENLSFEQMRPKAKKWINEFFTAEDDENKTLDLDLIKIARHIAQSKPKKAPEFITFKERDSYDLDKIAEDLLYKNEFEIQDALRVEYFDTSKIWDTFYKSFDRFKTAFDAQKNRVYHLIKFNEDPKFIVEKSKEIPEKRELTEYDKKQILKRDNYTCLCCGKENGKGVRLEIDHILPFKFGGRTTIENHQTLCNICNKEKNVNEIIFYNNHKTPLNAPKEKFEFPNFNKNEKAKYVLKRTINFFYHCDAVMEIKNKDTNKIKHKNIWHISLYKGNNPDWINEHKTELINFFRNEMRYTELDDILIK